MKVVKNEEGRAPTVGDLRRYRRKHWRPKPNEPALAPCTEWWLGGNKNSAKLWQVKRVTGNSVFAVPIQAPGESPDGEHWSLDEWFRFPYRRFERFVPTLAGFPKGFAGPGSAKRSDAHSACSGPGVGARPRSRRELRKISTSGADPDAATFQERRIDRLGRAHSLRHGKVGDDLGGQYFCDDCQLHFPLERNLEIRQACRDDQRARERNPAALAHGAAYTDAQAQACDDVIAFQKAAREELILSAGGGGGPAESEKGAIAALIQSLPDANPDSSVGLFDQEDTAELLLAALNVSDTIAIPPWGEEEEEASDDDDGSDDSEASSSSSGAAADTTTTGIVSRMRSQVPELTEAEAEALLRRIQFWQQSAHAAESSHHSSLAQEGESDSASSSSAAVGAEATTTLLPTPTKSSPSSPAAAAPLTPPWIHDLADLQEAQARERSERKKKRDAPLGGR